MKRYTSITVMKTVRSWLNKERKQMLALAPHLSRRQIKADKLGEIIFPLQ